MSKHLPECIQAEPTASRWPGDCICDRLRACEQRVREDAKPHNLCGACWRGDHSCELPVRCTCRWCNFAAGVQAARDAVEAHFHAGCDSCDAAFIFGMHALAAIDALRGES